MSKSLSNNDTSISDSITLSNGTSFVTLAAPPTGVYILSLPSNLGVLGQFLSTNGAGQTSWASLPAGVGSVLSVSADASGAPFLTVSVSNPTTTPLITITGASIGTGSLVRASNPTISSSFPSGITLSSTVSQGITISSSAGGSSELLGMITTGSSNPTMTFGRARTTGNSSVLTFNLAGSNNSLNNFKWGFYGGVGGHLTIYNDVLAPSVLNTPLTITGALGATNAVLSGSLTAPNAVLSNSLTAASAAFSTPLPISSGGTGLNTAGLIGQVLTSTGLTNSYQTPFITSVNPAEFIVTASVLSLSATLSSAITTNTATANSALASATTANATADSAVAAIAITNGLVAANTISITALNGNQIALNVPSFLSVSGSPATGGAGTFTIGYSGTALPVLNGGTGVTTSTGTGSTVRSGDATLTGLTTMTKTKFDSSEVRKIDFFSGTDFQFSGFTNAGGTTRYHCFTPGDNHIFYSGNVSSYNELFKINGGGGFVSTGNSTVTGSLDISVPLSTTSGGTGTSSIGSPGQYAIVNAGGNGYSFTSGPGGGGVSSVGLAADTNFSGFATISTSSSNPITNTGILTLNMAPNPAITGNTTVNGTFLVNSTESAHATFLSSNNPRYLTFGESTTSNGNASSLGFTKVGDNDPNNFMEINFWGLAGGLFRLYNSTSIPATLNCPFTISGLLTTPGVETGSVLKNRKLVSYATTPSSNEHQFNGIGTQPAGQIYQVDATTANHVFYAATSSTTSNELFRINGTGGFISAGSGTITNNLFVTGTTTSTPVCRTAIKTINQTIPWNGGFTVLSWGGYANTNSGTGFGTDALRFTNTSGSKKLVFVSYTIFWDKTITAQTLTIAIRKNGFSLFGLTRASTASTQTFLVQTGSSIVDLENNDYFEIVAENTSSAAFPVNLDIIGGSYLSNTEVSQFQAYYLN